MSTQQPFLVDIGNVLCTFDFQPLLQTLRTRSTNVGADPIARFAETKDLYETGRWDDAEFFAHVSQAIGFQGDQNEFESLWTGVFEENKAMTSLVETLSDAGHPLYLLSNTNRLHLDFLRANFPVFERFDGGVFSHEAGSIKPDGQIYQIALEQYSLRPADTFYIDDLPANIEAGERLGLISHRYDHADHAACEQWLAANGITV